MHHNQVIALQRRIFLNGSNHVRVISRLEALAKLRDLAKQGLITLLFAAHNAEHNNAVVLREVLLGKD